MKTPKYLFKIQGLTLRSLIIGSLGSVIITASSMYTGLRTGAVPWPTLFATMLSMLILRFLFHSYDPHEINIAQSAMTAGAMVSAGLAFTLPAGIIYLNSMNMSTNDNYLIFKVICVTLSGFIVGILLTWKWRKKFIIEQNLPYPIGVACAKTITSTAKNSKSGMLLIVSIIISAIFTFFRDAINIIPSTISSEKLTQKNMQNGITVMPLAFSIGYIIGPLYTFFMMAFSIITFIIFIPITLQNNIFTSFTNADSFRQSIGLGALVGSGIGILLKILFDYIKKNKLKLKNKIKFNYKNINNFNYKRVITVVLFIITYLLLTLAQVNFIISILVICFCYFATLVASAVTGQSGIDPLEVFGMILVIIILLIFPEVPIMQLIFIATFVAIASGFAGDIMFEYKAGYILGTNPKAQLISQAIGGIIGVIISVIVFFVLTNQFGYSDGSIFIVPQAKGLLAIANKATGLYSPLTFLISAIITAVLIFFNIPSVAIALGIYLPIQLTTAFFVGGVVSFVVKKFKPHLMEKGLIVSSGVIGGESITSIIIVLINMAIQR